jgi:Tol biopolymer transport system component
VQQIGYMAMDSTRKTYPFVQTSVNWAPRFSPDGKWVAYSSDESSRPEIYVRPFPGPGGRFQVSNDGGLEPVWARDGRTLYYRQDRRLIAASVSTAPSFTVTGRRTVFQGTFDASGPHASYDVALDGKHFLMLAPSDDRPSVVVVLNWASEARARLFQR